MARKITNFLKQNCGQDLAEYCLLVALVSLIGAGIFYRVSGGMQNLWTTANSSISAGGAPAAGGDAAASTPNH